MTGTLTRAGRSTGGWGRLPGRPGTPLTRFAACEIGADEAAAACSSDAAHMAAADAR
ncbi:MULTISPECIES: hypothetical protein [unclassified Streptomyces]|uniref:hypothetical protein n=1 Tax=unclassified Streptomyces TaxID=2593676 RepID=UPI003369FE36